VRTQIVPRIRAQPDDGRRLARQDRRPDDRRGIGRRPDCAGAAAAPSRMPRNDLRLSSMLVIRGRCCRGPRIVGVLVAGIAIPAPGVGVVAGRPPAPAAITIASWLVAQQREARVALLAVRAPDQGVV
jgi:hypothetical protein